ncbi:amidase domain-containing protein [Streptomyces sp. ISL-96]|uniref:amidase domain-containing protein n=1 Tax=Streptomyces sp. ISL-96 TaxID=2819191 RepID=UPI00203514CA|nr:amidase domain-containing protein [Streptomyces sp. ISL-96]
MKSLAVGALAVALSAVLLPVHGANAAVGNGSEHTDGASAERTVDEKVAGDFAALADAVLTKRTSALLDGARPAARAATAAVGDVRISSRLARAEDRAVTGLLDRKARLAELREGYTAADVDVDIEKVDVTGDRATAEATETTVLTYKQIRGDEPPTTGFQARHKLTFTAAADGTWQLTGIASVDEGGPAAVNAPDTVVVDEGGEAAPSGEAAGTTKPAQPQSKLSATAGYNYTAMAKYAEKYWKNYNPSYRTFNGVGGDCTNFISQSLRAGGWKNDTGWYKSYKNWWYNSSNQTWSWTSVNYWASFALHSKRTYNLSNVYHMGVGDILQMDFSSNGSKDHSMITTYRSSSGVPYLTYHSNDTYRKSVASIVASNRGATYYAFRT